MIGKSILPWLVLGLLSGCAAMLDNTRFYDGSMPESPQRWPDQVETCGHGRTVLIPMRLVVSATVFTHMPGYRGGCGSYAKGMSRINIRDADFMGATRFGVDGTGRGRNFNVYYDWQLGKDSDFKPDNDYDPDWSWHMANGIWQYNQPLPVDKKSLVINGLTWRHYMFYGFYSYSADPLKPGIPVEQEDTTYVGYPLPVIQTPQPRALEWIGEVYSHRIDADHKMMVWASYDRTVTQDAHWLKVRRAMLRDLVKAVTIKPLTPELLRNLQAEKQAQDQCMGNGGGSECTRIGRWSDQISSN